MQIKKPQRSVGKIAGKFISTTLAASFLFGATIFSTITPASAVAVACTVNGDGSGDYETIQAAINNNCTSILLAAGTYSENVNVDSVTTINGAGKDTTIVDGGGAGTVFEVTAGGLTLKNLTVQNGSGTTKAAGIHAGAYPLTLDGVIVQNNEGGSYGGGIGSSSANVTIKNSKVTNNATSDGPGGGLYMFGATLTVMNSEFTSNYASKSTVGGYGGVGGAMFLDTVTTANIDSSLVYNNNAEYGAGIYSAASDVNVTDSTFKVNLARKSGGAFVSGGNAGGGSIVSINSSTFFANGASENAGALSFGNSQTPYDPVSITIMNSTFSGNYAGRNGGAIEASVVKDAPFLIKNTTITDNTSDSNNDSVGAGGGIYVWKQSETGDNSVVDIQVKNTIIADNKKAYSTGDDCNGTIQSLGHNLIQYTDGCTFTGDTTGHVTGKDANLGPLASNGGKTQTHALLTGSPAIDAGNNGTCLSTDQRGTARPVGSACDIGAFEGSVAPSSTKIYRFWSDSKQGHFYTIHEWEKDLIIAKDKSWKYEGEAFKALPLDQCGSKSKIYRFWSDTKQKHFYTIQEWEKNAIMANDKSWKFEGEAFCASQESISGTTAVYRFWSDKKQGHFYTTQKWEKDSIIKNDPSWKYEGVAYYAFN